MVSGDDGSIVAVPTTDSEGAPLDTGIREECLAFRRDMHEEFTAFRREMREGFAKLIADVGRLILESEARQRAMFEKVLSALDALDGRRKPRR